MNNNLYNLMHQLTQEQKSLWRIDGSYMEDAAGMPELQDFWKKLAEDKKNHIEELQALIKKHI